MLKNAILFAVSSLVIAGLAPTFMPNLFGSQAPQTNAPAPAVAPEAVETPAPAHFEPEPRPTTMDLEVALPSDRVGQFWADVLINGQYVHMLVDTGASFVSLSADVADRLGLTQTVGEPRVTFNTASGTVYATPTVLSKVQVGSISLTDVRAFVPDRRAGAVTNLLGMNFLKRLHGVEQRDGYLYLRQ